MLSTQVKVKVSLISRQTIKHETKTITTITKKKLDHLEILVLCLGKCDLFFVFFHSESKL